MASITCKCGERLSNNSIPDEISILAYTEQEWDKVTCDIKEIAELPRPRNTVWRCPKCERIYVWNQENILIKQYVLEL